MIDRKSKKKIKEILRYILISIIMLIILSPFFIMLFSSFMGEEEIYNNIYPNFHLIPNSPTIGSYIEIFTEHGRFYKTFINNIQIASYTMIIVVIVSSLAAYGISRIQTKRKGTILFLFLFGSMLPPMVILIPLYTQVVRLKLYDTKLAIVLVLSVYLIPFSVWIMKSFFDTIPKSLEEASLIDGCNRFQSLYKVILPLATPGIGAIAVYSFIAGWNEFLVGMILSQVDAQPFTVWIANFVNSEKVEFTKLLAAGVIGCIPVVLLAFIFQKLIVRGLIEGAVKG